MGNWLEIVNVKKNFGSVEALKGVSFTSSTNGIIGLIGPNGAGKTTLLKILLGLIKKDDGECYLLGNNVWKKNVTLKREIGVVLERNNFPPNLDVKQYLNFVCSIYNIPSNERNLEFWLDKFDLPDNRKISELSEGMRRKAILLAAIIPKPKILILDEPTANIDPLGREEILKLINNISKTLETNFIISSHLLFDLEKIASEVIVLKEGSIIESGKTLSILQKYSHSNKYSCTVLEIKKFISILENQEWVKSAEREMNHILIEVQNLESTNVFERILLLARQNNIQLLNLNRFGDLIQILRKDNNQ